jgi:IrrE N-terminal-like domain
MGSDLLGTFTGASSSLPVWNFHPFVCHIRQEHIGSFVQLMGRKRIECLMVDSGDTSAGSIRVVKRAANAKEHTLYRMLINRNHAPAIQFATMVHELGHLFLGHLGPDKAGGGGVPSFVPTL